MLPRLLMYLVLFVALLLPCHSKKTDPLIRWLDQLRIDIPDQSYKNGILHLTVQDLHCTHFTIQSIDSTQSSIGVHGVGASCQGRYGASGMTGQLTAKLGSRGDTSKPDFQWSYRISNAANTTIPIPDAWTTVSCETHIAVTDLHFDGSWSAKLIDLFRSAIEKGINDAVSSETICPQFQANVDPMVTSYIRKGVEFLQQYLPDGRTTTEQQSLPQRSLATSSPSPDAIVFSRDLPVLTNLLKTTNTFVNQHLNHGLLPNATACGFARGFNGIIQTFVPDGIHIAAAPIEFQMHHLYNDATVTLRLEDWHIAGDGLHEWEELQVMVPRDDDSLFSHAKTTNLGISVKSSITVDIPSSSSEPLFETFHAGLNLTDLDVSADMMLDLNRLLFQNVTAGDVISALQHLGTWTPAVACLVNPISQLALKSLSTAVHVFSLQLHTESSDNDRIEEDVDTLINHAAGFILDQYATFVSEAIYGISQGPMLDSINEFLDQQIHDISTNCSHKDSSSDGDSWIDFTQVEPLKQLNHFLNDPNTMTHMNDCIDCAMSVVDKLLEKKLASLSSLVQFDYIQLEHFGSFQTLNLLLPTNTTMLQSSFAIGDTFRQPQLTARAWIPDFGGEISLAISLSNLTLSTAAKLLYNQNVLDQTPMAELLSKGQCLFAPTHDVGLTYFDGSFGRLHVNSSVEVRIHNSTYAVSFVSTDFPEIQDFAWTIFEWSISTMHKAANAIAAATVGSAHRTCSPSSESSNNSKSDENDRELTAHSLWVILGTLFVLSQPLILLFRNRGKAEIPAPSSSLSEPLLRQLSSTGPDDPHVQENSSSLMGSYESHSIQYILPVTILFTIVLFLASNSSIGATVDLSLSQPAQTVAVPAIYSFGLIDTAKNMLSAGIYPLFILVVVFSGIWPYAKLVLMFSAWVSPSNILSVKTREVLLRTLDSFSKYSLVDSYVFIVMLVAFRYHVEANGTGYYAFDVFVSPLFGFYGFLLATTLSLVIGHVLIYYHRHDALRDTLNAWPSDVSSSLMTHRFKLMNGTRGYLSPAFVCFLIIVFVATVALLALGLTQKSFSFDFGGVAGFLLGEEKSHVVYSVLSLWKAIPESVDDGGFAAKLLQAAFFFYTIATPFICLLLLALLSICPLSLPGQIYLLSAAEIANSWSALEVFVLSILAALFEISTFSSFIVGDRCYLINEITATYSKLDDPSCFSVRCTVTWESLYLIIGTIFLSIWVSLVLRLTRLCIVERISDGTSDEASVLAVLAERFPWMCTVAVCADDSADLPVISDERIASRWTESASTSGVWDETTKDDPCWKDWKDTTNVT